MRLLLPERGDRADPLGWRGPACCNDYFVADSLGDLSRVSVRALWKRSEELRGRIFVGDYDLSICRVCVGTEPAAEPLSTLRTDNAGAKAGDSQGTTAGETTA